MARPVVTSVSQATRPLGSSSKMASRTASEIWSASLSGCPSVTDSEVNRYRCAMIAGVYRPPPHATPGHRIPDSRTAGRPLGTGGEELGDAVEDRAGQLGLGPGPERLVVAGRRQDHRVVRLAAEPGPGAAHLVDHDEVEALRLELASPGGLEALGLGGEPDEHRVTLAFAQLLEDVPGWDQLERGRAGVLLQLLLRDVGGAPVGHGGRLDHGIRLVEVS